MDLKALRALRGKTTDMAKITSALEKMANPEKKSYKDDRFWGLTGDKLGNGSATIRFLPSLSDESLPWAKVYHHGFKGPTGKWYIENSLTTLNEADPVSELNSELWNSGIEANKEVARAQKRKLNYICNILVISDPKNPENEGKVFLFKFGKKIFDKIMDKARPTFEDETPVNVFGIDDGANFKFRMRKVEGYSNYDQSTFEAPSALAGGNEEKMVKILDSLHDLNEFTDRKNFKSYEELKKKLQFVLSGAGGSGGTAGDEPLPEAPAPEAGESKASKPIKSVSVPIDDEDDDLAAFARIANE